jgi:hypothetical protein
MAVTVSDVAKALGISSCTVRNWIEDGLVVGAQKLPNTRWSLPDNVMEQLTSKKVLIVFDTQMFRWLAKDFAVYKRYEIVGYVNINELSDINELKSIIEEKCANAIISKDTLNIDLDDSITRFTF